MTESGSITLRAACEGLSAKFLGPSHVRVTSATVNSHAVEIGGLFGCLTGATVDGHDFIGQAIDNGAVALLVEKSITEFDVSKVAVALVEDTRRAIGPISSRIYGEPSRSLSCFGVTGTNGKTTTVHMLASIARAGDEKVGTVGTLGANFSLKGQDREQLSLSGLTTPEAPALQDQLAQMQQAGITTVAMEVSSHALSQFRVDGTQFKMVCFTNLGHDHLDFHGDMDSYLLAKTRLFTPVFSDRAAINIDDSSGVHVANAAEANGLSVTTFGLSPEADITATAIEYSISGTNFVITDRRTDESVEVSTNFLGEINVLNALAAAALAQGGGHSLAISSTGLANATVVSGRLERIENTEPFTVLLDYAHTPDALAAALRAARTIAFESRVLLVFGCGGNRDFEKRPAMGLVAVAGAEVVVITSDNPRSEDPIEIANQITAKIDKSSVSVELDRRAAIRQALNAARPGDVVVIAGKGHETSQIFRTTTVAHDDRVVIQEELARL